MKPLFFIYLFCLFVVSYSQDQNSLEVVKKRLLSYNDSVCLCQSDDILSFFKLSDLGVWLYKMEGDSAVEAINVDSHLPVAVTDSILKQAINSLLPLDVYFENDVPSVASADTARIHNYHLMSLLDEYMGRKKFYYKNYIKKVKSRKDIKVLKKKDQDEFFQDLECSVLKLKFLKAVLDQLDGDENVEFTFVRYINRLNVSERGKWLSNARRYACEEYLFGAIADSVASVSVKDVVRDFVVGVSVEGVEFPNWWKHAKADVVYGPSSCRMRKTTIEVIEWKE